MMKKRGQQEKLCLICGQSSLQSICPSCQAKVQGEAVEKKQKIEKKVRTEKEKSAIPEVPPRPPAKS